MFLSSHAILKSISIHAPAKGATKWIAKNPEAYAFQSTLPRRERRCIYPLVIYCSLFQSTLPRRERRWGKSDAETRVFYFNPRSREGSDGRGKRSLDGCGEFQSTLPRRERRPAELAGITNQFDFNPRSREGSDSVGLVREYYVQDFNPRSREGSDQGQPLWHANRMISIHAPAKGATATGSPCLQVMTFQSTLPRRERPDHILACLLPINFNPRSREGSDVRPVQVDSVLLQFQSTLPRRERQHLLTSFRLQYGYSLFHLTNKI